ncbi:hypothetical protein BJ742DRAFT_684869, partial [Cladochytrium replicatum]
MAKNVPAFLNKLYNMVCDASTSDLIHWSESGASFIVQRHEDFAREVLPRFFKHNNFSSFVRQLNMYGFHKVPHINQGVLHSDAESELWEFSNPHFQRGQPDLLCLVSRKKHARDPPSAATTGLVSSASAAEPTDKPASKPASTPLPVDLASLVQDIAAIKRHQITISADLKHIQSENRVLWTESVSLRDRYDRQQQTIDKILRFLASLFSSVGGGNVQGGAKVKERSKRRLLIGDG